MAADAPGEHVSFDPEAVLRTAREVLDEGQLLICSVYDARTFETVYVDDRVDGMYPTEDARAEHFAEVHDYVHLDFEERDLFEDLFLESGGVDSFVTFMGNLVVVRVVSGKEGVFLALAPGTGVTAVVEAIREEIRDRA